MCSFVAVVQNGHNVSDIPSAAGVKRDVVVAWLKSLIKLRDDKEKLCESIGKELRVLLNNFKLVTSYEKEIDSLNINVMVLQCASDEPSDVDMLNPAKFDSLVAAINQHNGLNNKAVPVKAAAPSSDPFKSFCTICCRYSSEYSC